MVMCFCLAQKQMLDSIHLFQKKKYRMLIPCGSVPKTNGGLPFKKKILCGICCRNKYQVLQLIGSVPKTNSELSSPVIDSKK